MSVAATPTSELASATTGSVDRAPAAQPAVDAACPLCGTPLQPDQEWCLGCGAAARTRLAAPTNWKAPVLALALVVALALGALAAALVSLTGPAGSSAAPPAITRTIATPPLGLGGAAGTGATTGAGPSVGAGGVTAPATPGAINPGTPTTISPSSTSGGAGGASTTGTAGSAGSGLAPGGRRLPRRTEEALRKAGFPLRGGK